MAKYIEPRLIHLLNDSQTPDLPPIQLLPFSSAADQSLSLPPLEPDAGQRSDKSTQIPPLYAVNDDSCTKQNTWPDNGFSNDASCRFPNSGHPLQMLLGDSEANSSTLPLRMLVDDTPDIPDDLSTKKRHRALTTKDDFVQLPQPLKKQKSTQQVVPPIINGLHEPPPNAAVFPPITGSFEDSEALNLSLLKDFNTAAEDRAVAASTSDVDKNSSSKGKRRATKPRRKWLEEETNHLLIGVSRHGVGKWTSILEDPDFKFNDRTAGDLKDRFRTCCPDELRGQTAKRRSDKATPDPVTGTDDNRRPTNRPLLENILIEPEAAAATPDMGPQLGPPESESAPKQRKSRAHRKKLEDLAELGINAPFKKSHRRERRPFTEQDDKEILEGLDKYGPAWTKIQRDPKYNLSSRQPTDLRDRVRNKYPDTYAKIEKGNFQVKDQPAGQPACQTSGRGASNVLEPSVNTTIANSLNSAMAGSLGEPQLTRSSSKEDMSKWHTNSSTAAYESTESLPGSAGVFDLNEASASSFLGGSSAPEMDIARLLILDDSQIAASSEQARLG
ncbi:hypothetical protein B0T22DRAFT_354332, partial [Podospora appendiculata]